MRPVARRVAAWAAAAAWCALIFTLSHQPDPPGPSWLDAVPFADKIAHFLIYAVLCALLARALRLEPSALLRRRALVLAVACAVLYGVSDEWHQSFVPGRQPDVMDLAADALGALCAAGLIRHFYKNYFTKEYTSTAAPKAQQ